MNTSIWTKTVGIVILIFLFETPLLTVSSIEGNPTSIQFLSQITKPFENLTAFAEGDDSSTDSNDNSTPEPTEPTPEPTPGPTPGPTPEPIPGPTPEPTPEPTPGPTPKTEPKTNPKTNPKTEPRPTAKPDQKSPQKPKPREKKDTFKGTGTSNNTNVKSNPINSSNTYNTNNTYNTSETTDESSTSDENNKELVEEIELEEVNEVEVNINELSIQQLINMLEKGELKWEANDDKYLIMLTEGEGHRELTTEEAIKLGIIAEDSEEGELVENQDEVEETDDVNELTSDYIEEVQLLSDNKNDKRKAPFYISAIGLITVLAGSLMYFIQWRKD